MIRSPDPCRDPGPRMTSGELLALAHSCLDREGVRPQVGSTALVREPSWSSSRKGHHV
jgi:hypothetical protein